MMEYRTFGEAGTRLSVLGLGCSRIGSFGNHAPIKEIRGTLACALDRGVTVFDTANIYGQGDSERELGRALAPCRDKVFVVTKLGKRFSAKMRMLRPLKPLVRQVLARRPGVEDSLVAQRDANMAEDFAPARFRVELDASLRRLRFDHVDAILLHSPPAAALAVPGVPEALADLVASGRARFFGVSVDDHACLAAAMRLPGLSLVQATPDVLDEAAASGVAQQMRRLKVGVFVREVIRAQPGLAPPDAVARAVARPDVTCAIVGTSRPAHLDGLIDGLAGGLVGGPAAGRA